MKIQHVGKKKKKKKEDRQILTVDNIYDMDENNVSFDSMRSQKLSSTKT